LPCTDWARCRRCIAWQAPLLSTRRANSSRRKRGWRLYDIGPDGRFVIIRSGDAEARDASVPNLVVVQHWAEVLKRLVAAT
jgi:hypothetical protein